MSRTRKAPEIVPSPATDPERPEIGDAGPEVDQVEQVRSGAPLFSTTGGESLSHIDVHRIEPIEEEGFAGRVPPGTTEQELRGRFGGGRYRLTLKNMRHKVAGNTTLSIGGDPIFLSAVAEARWKRGTGQKPDEPPPAPAALALAPAAAGLGLPDLMAVMQHMQTMQAQEQARRDAEHERRETQRRRDDEERDRRRDREAVEQRERDQQHLTTMIQLITTISKPSGGGGDGQSVIDAFTNGMKTALAMQPPAPAAPARGGRGGDEDDDEDDDDRGGRKQDPIAEAVQGAVRGLVDAVTGRGAPAPAAAPPDDGSVKVTGPLADQLKDLVQEAASTGRNPDELLSVAFKTMKDGIQRRKARGQLGAVPAAAPAAAAPQVSETPPAPPPAPSSSSSSASAAVMAAAAHVPPSFANGSSLAPS